MTVALVYPILFSFTPDTGKRALTTLSSGDISATKGTEGVRKVGPPGFAFRRCLRLFQIAVPTCLPRKSLLDIVRRRRTVRPRHISSHGGHYGELRNLEEVLTRERGSRMRVWGEQRVVKCPQVQEPCSAIDFGATKSDESVHVAALVCRRARKNDRGT